MDDTHSNLFVGLDFFESSRVALAEAKRLHRKRGGSLLVAHVIDERFWHQIADDYRLDHDEVIAKAQHQVESSIDSEDPSIRALAVVGHPVEALWELCQENHIDTLILGAQGSHHKERNLEGLGHVASRLLRHAPCSLLLVRKTQDHPFRRIVAGVDFSEVSTRVVQQAIRIAEQDEAELTFVHILPHLQDPPTMRSPLEALGVYSLELQGQSQEGLARKASETLEALVEEHQYLIQRATVRTQIVTHDDARAGLLHQIEATQAELIVTGKLGHSKIREIMLGSTAEKIANVAPCSVLAVT